MKTFEEFRFSIPHDKVRIYKYSPTSKNELIEAIEAEIEDQGPEADLNCIDTSEITSMACLFDADKHKYAKNFNGDISKWNVSNVTNMAWMFNYAEKFNRNISNWNVANVEEMSGMFYYAESFNQDISKWNVSNVINMCRMFGYAKTFDQDISNWDISNVQNMEYMFYGAKSFNQDISNWDMSNTKNFYMLIKCPIKEEYKPKFN